MSEQKAARYTALLLLVYGLATTALIAPIFAPVVRAEPPKLFQPVHLRISLDGIRAYTGMWHKYSPYAGEKPTLLLIDNLADFAAMAKRFQHGYGDYSPLKTYLLVLGGQRRNGSHFVSVYSIHELTDCVEVHCRLSQEPQKKIGYVASPCEFVWMWRHDVPKDKPWRLVDVTPRGTYEATKVKAVPLIPPGATP